MSGSGVWSYSLRTVTEGAHSWKAALRRASSSSSKSASRKTSSVAMSNSPVPLNTSGPETWMSRLTEAWFWRAAPTPNARM